MTPFGNEPILELRRAPVRAQLGDALAALDADAACGCRCGSATSAARATSCVSTDPGDAGARRAPTRPPRPDEAEVDAAVRVARRGVARWRATPAAQRAEVLVARRRVAARAPRSSSPRWRCARREAVARGRRRRLRGDRLPRVLRARGGRRSTQGAPLLPGRPASATSCAGAARRRRRDLALELPGRDPAAG